MQKKNIIRLSVILIVLVIIAVILNSDLFDKSSTMKKPERLFEIDSAAVDKVVFEHKGKTLVLKKSANWRLEEPVDYLANNSYVYNLLSNLKNYKILSREGENPDNLQIFGFQDTNTFKLTVFQGETQVGSMLIGKPRTEGAAQVYIKNLEGNEVYLADGIIYSYVVRQDFNEWRDLNIFSVPKGAIKSVEYIYKDDSFKMVKDTLGRFFIGKDSVSQTVMDGLLNLFSNFNTQTFKDSTIGDDVKFDFTANIEWDKITTVNMLKYGDEENYRYIIKVSDTKQLFDVDKNFSTLIMKSRKELLGK
ncbi:MAG: DUF4340 domain-containing protein [Ignavibacteria bacterium]|nr:DUF4340 domain-containing protein [Ignavibacteria bacterium]